MAAELLLRREELPTDAALVEPFELRGSNKSGGPRGADADLKVQFPQELTRARGGSAARLISIINQAAPQDWRAAAWILERRFRQDFGRNVVEVTGEDGGPLQVDVASLQRVILKALESHPDARVDVARAQVEID